MFNKKKSTYTLADIEKLFIRIPTVSILILSLLLMIITYFILDFKQKRDIDLIKQKQIINYQFEKKEKLYNFIHNLHQKYKNDNISKDKIIKAIEQNKNKTDDFLWFFDITNKKVFNYFNKKELLPLKAILYQNSNTLQANILKYYTATKKLSSKYKHNTYVDKKFNYLISISYNPNIAIDIKQIITIKYQYKKMLYSIILFIVVFTAVLLLFSILFTNFIKTIFGKYNSELKNKTQSLEHWKKRFELAIIASNDGLWDIDFKDDKIYFSHKWLTMFGYQENQLQTLKDWFDLIHPNDIDLVKSRFQDIFDEKTDSLQCEYRLKTNNNDYKWVFARGKIFTNEHTKSKRMLMMSMDIDKNKKMIKELLDIELLVEDGRLVIIKFDNNKRLSTKYISNSIKTYGYIKSDFEHNYINFLDIVYDEDKKPLIQSIESEINKGVKDFNKIFRIVNAKGDIKWIFLRAILLKDYFANVTQIYGYFHDITKIKVSQEELKLKVKQEVEKNIKKDRLLVQQNKLASMGEMLGNIAHQWRQPLNTVNLIIHYLRDNYQNEQFTKEQFEKYINKAKTQIDYMSHTIDDFRNFYKPSKTANKFNISDVIYNVKEILKEQFEKENIKLKLITQDIFITNYENELKQALLNILNNAKDAIVKKRENTPLKGKIKVILSKKDESVQIIIKNNGGNIPNDIINRIFEPYFTTKFEKQGTGIGLYMSQIIIQTNMKGKIKVQNIKNGVKFKITLPFSLDDK